MGEGLEQTRVGAGLGPVNTEGSSDTSLILQMEMILLWAGHDYIKECSHYTKMGWKLWVWREISVQKVINK